MLSLKNLLPYIQVNCILLSTNSYVAYGQSVVAGNFYSLKKKQQQQKHKNQMRFLTNIACSISVLNILARDHLKHFVFDMKA